MLRLIFCIGIVLVPAALCEPVLYWTFKGEITPGFELNSLKKPMENEKLVVFAMPGFNMASFSEAADVYSRSSTGGKLDNLKASMKSGSDYALLDVKSNPLDFIRNQIEDDLPASQMSTFTLANPDLSGRVIYAYAGSYEELDALVAMVSKALANSKYDAVVMGQEAEEKHSIAKRSLTATTGGSGETFISDNNCLLYIQQVSFIVRQRGDQKVNTKIFVADSLDEKKSKVDCSSINGSTFSLQYSAFNASFKGTPDKDFNPVLSDLKLDFTINLLGSRKNYWALPTPSGGYQFGPRSQISVNADFTDKSLDFEDVPAVSTTSFEASTGFSFSCASPKEFNVNHTADMGKANPYTFSVQMFRIQIQPFNATNGGWTDPDDCMPFFTEGIWMALISILVLLMIFFFGICMIASIKTMDRFDDPRQKPMIVNVRE